jgi:hypothetical protein
VGPGWKGRSANLAVAEGRWRSIGIFDTRIDLSWQILTPSRQRVKLDGARLSANRALAQSVIASAIAGHRSMTAAHFQSECNDMGSHATDKQMQRMCHA